MMFMRTNYFASIFPILCSTLIAFPRRKISSSPRKKNSIHQFYKLGNWNTQRINKWCRIWEPGFAPGPGWLLQDQQMHSDPFRKTKGTEKLCPHCLKTHPRSCRAHFRFYPMSQRLVTWSRWIIMETGKYGLYSGRLCSPKCFIYKRRESRFWWTTL